MLQHCSTVWRKSNVPAGTLLFQAWTLGQTRSLQGLKVWSICSLELLQTLLELLQASYQLLWAQLKLLQTLMQLFQAPLHYAKVAKTGFEVVNFDK